MSRKVRCYNAYFGDCYAITDDEDKLVVDFGIYKSSKILDGKTIDNHLEEITNDLVTYYSNSEMLITHFHYDHICGFVRMVDKCKGRKIFSKIYIPNVWGFPKVVATNLLESIIASFLYDNEKLVSYSAGNISLLELINHLVKSGVKNVCNLKRGDKLFKNKYITLLPDDTILSKINDEYKDIRSQLEKLVNDMFTSLENDDEENETAGISGYLDDLEDFAEQIAQIFDAESISIEDNQDAIENIYNNYSLFEQEFLNYLARINTKDFLDALGKILKKLNKRGNKISIVFQNIDDNENILFTGDAERTDLNRILGASPSGTELDFKSKYKYLKLPHHGTERYYVDFTSYKIAAENVLIPNARVKGQQWCIAEEYGSFGENKYCSVANNCDCILSCDNLVGCTSIRNTIYPKLYLDV